MVVGPNGTGKSTILCAICLGLGGSPPLLGRADNATLFIKHEKDKATIEIELAPFPGKPVHVLKRVIDSGKGGESGKGHASTFYINNHKSTIKGVKELVTNTYKINIDNLCTFLPQDKVGNFSGFDKQALLAETEKSLSADLYETHQLMIEMEQQVKSSGNDVQSVQDALADLIKQNEKLERDKELMEERAAAQERMELLEKKRNWLIFEGERERAKELKGKKVRFLCLTFCSSDAMCTYVCVACIVCSPTCIITVKTQEELKKAKKEADKAIKPLQEKHAKVEGEVAQIISRSSALEKKVKETRKQFDDSLKKSETMQDAMDEEMNSLESMDAAQRLAEKQVEKERRRLKEIEADGADFPPMDEVDKAFNEASAEIRAIKSKIDGVRRKHQNLNTKIEEEEEKKKDAEQRLNRVKDEKTIRMQALFGANKNVKVIYDFVNQNRKIFRRPVWGPIGEACYFSVCI